VARAALESEYGIEIITEMRSLLKVLVLLDLCKDISIVLPEIYSRRTNKTGELGSDILINAHHHRWLIDRGILEVFSQCARDAVLFERQFLGREFMRLFVARKGLDWSEEEFNAFFLLLEITSRYVFVSKDGQVYLVLSDASLLSGASSKLFMIHSEFDLDFLVQRLVLYSATGVKNKDDLDDELRSNLIRRWIAESDLFHVEGRIVTLGKTTSRSKLSETEVVFVYLCSMEAIGRVHHGFSRRDLDAKMATQGVTKALTSGLISRSPIVSVSGERGKYLYSCVGNGL
jgi:hypothetical protein